MIVPLRKRDDDDYYDWDPTTEIIVKWVVFVALIIIVIVFVILARTHAKRRARAGKNVLFYHKFLLSHRERLQFDPSYQSRNTRTYFFNPTNPPAQSSEYPLNSVPPPAYNANFAAPPSYEPPMGGSKVDPNQSVSVRQVPVGGESSTSEQTTGVINPSDAPTEPVRAHTTGGSTNPFRH